MMLLVWIWFDFGFLICILRAGAVFGYKLFLSCHPLERKGDRHHCFCFIFLAWRVYITVYGISIGDKEPVSLEQSIHNTKEVLISLTSSLSQS